MEWKMSVKNYRKKSFKWQYACAAHFLSTFTKDIGMHLSKDLNKNCASVLKKIKNNAMVGQIFDKICYENHQRTYASIELQIQIVVGCLHA